jgi:hypothetical protein
VADHRGEFGPAYEWGQWFIAMGYNNNYAFRCLNTDSDIKNLLGIADTHEHKSGWIPLDKGGERKDEHL